MKRKQTLLVIPLALILAGSCLVYGESSEDGNSKLGHVSFHRPLTPLLGTKRVLAMLVSHESLKPSAALTAEKMRALIEGVKKIYADASNNTVFLEPTVVPEPVLLPGNISDYQVPKVPYGILHAAANREVVAKYGSELDPDTFDAVVYFYPTDTNVEPFGVLRFKHTFGLRFKPAVANIGLGQDANPPAIAHEIGHALFMYAHAASADPKTGELLKGEGDPYEVMGYGLNRNLFPAGHLSMAYRYYWGWTKAEEITIVTEPGTFSLEPGRALLVPTNKDNLLWLEIIRAEQAYGDETGGLLVHIDKAGEKGISHSTLDMTPATEYKADLHMTPGQSISFEAREITYVKRIEKSGSKTPSAEIKIGDDEKSSKP
ncbi:MAG: hypothetical protein ACE15E_06820 [Acidobacteriota bacterium]